MWMQLEYAVFPLRHCERSAAIQNQAEVLCSHCEERRDEAIQAACRVYWIAALRSQ
jgi:hypothetical protein